MMVEAKPATCGSSAGAGEGIRTLDPNLGKQPNSSFK
jgi:hypothetical protein